MENCLKIDDKTIYRQCYLERKINNTLECQTCWIPNKFAKVGRVLKIKDGEWTDGWIVKFVGKSGSAPNVRKQIKSHRRNTGDLLPK